MTIYKQTRVLNQIEAGYLAGLIDGEGTISLVRKHQGENRQLVVSISNTEKRILEYVKEILGVGKITNKRTYQPHHIPSAAYVISNRQALSLLQQIAPLLKSYKAKRATLVLNDYIRLTSRNGKYSPTQKSDREAFIQKFFTVRDVKFQC